LPTLTVFTPTYNRADKLVRVYESLKQQTNKDFCWLIADDGSTDDTAGAVRSMQEENAVNIKYIRRENGGKMRAHNTGVKACETPLFLCLDSDDLLPDNAVDRILGSWSRVSADDRYAGIIAYKGESADRPIYGNVFPETDDCSFRELYRKGFKGETTLILRTDLLKEHLFPEIEGEKYVPEDVVYDRIDEGHIFMILPEILTVCELMEEGYTDRVEELRCEAPTGWYIYYYQRAMSWPPSLMKLKFASHYLRFRERADRKYVKELKLPLHLVLAGLPGCVLLTLRGKL
jgi:glycosyltransferase involved in cell wall biosynthesis